MSSKSKIIISGILFTLITVFIYLLLRVDTIEKDYIDSVLNSSHDVIIQYKKFNSESAQANESSTGLNRFMNPVMKRYSNIALIAVADMNYKIHLAKKNNGFIPTDKLYDRIMDDFTNQKLTIPSNMQFIKVYYDIITNNTVEEKKFYIFNELIDNSRLLFIYPYQPRKKILTRIGLEGSLIIIFYIIATSIIYIISDKKGSILSYELEEDETDPSSRSSVDLSSKYNSIEQDTQRITESSLGVASDTLSSYVFNFFNRIYSEKQSDSIALYLKSSNNVLSKSFEMKGNSFIKIDSPGFDTINYDSSFINELYSSNFLIMEEGIKTIIPVIHDNSLLGIISIIRENPMSMDEVTEIRSQLDVITKELSNYIVLSTVMTDRGTGLYSKTYFELKYNELIKSGETDKSEFSIMLLSLNDEDDMVDEYQKNKIIKLLAPAITANLNGNHYLCLYDKLLGIILPGVDAEKVRVLAAEIEHTLLKYRIKLSKDYVLKLNPYFGISSTDSSTDRQNVLNSAMIDLKSKRK